VSRPQAGFFDGKEAAAETAVCLAGNAAGSAGKSF
jgi:hypothetical protein